MSVLVGDARSLPLPDACVDAVVCDPPYGTQGGDKGGYGRREIWGRGGATIANDEDLSVLAGALPEMLRVLKSDAWLAIFISPRKQLDARLVIADSGLELFGECVWDKREAGLGHPIRYAHETIIICRKGNPPEPKHALLSSYTGRAPFRINREHPHEKPIPLMRELVRWCCPEGGTVLDVCAGSGSTGVAAILEGRNPILVELTTHWAMRADERCRYTNPVRDPDSLFSILEESA